MGIFRLFLIGHFTDNVDNNILILKVWPEGYWEPSLCNPPALSGDLEWQKMMDETAVSWHEPRQCSGSKLY